MESKSKDLIKCDICDKLEHNEKIYWGVLHNSLDKDVKFYICKECLLKKDEREQSRIFMQNERDEWESFKKASK